MITSTIQYPGDLRTNCTHVQSGDSIITDAPTDNHGKGEAFSPTDLMATSLVSCMLTTMGIKAGKDGIPFKEASAEMQKIMASNPRRVAEIVVKVSMPRGDLSEEQIAVLEETGRNCPVARSLHPDVKQTITFEYA